MYLSARHLSSTQERRRSPAPRRRCRALLLQRRGQLLLATDGAQGTPRCYASALEAAEEAGRSRIYQGIHFQFANEDGRRVGRGIGAKIATSTLRRPGPPGRETSCAVK